MKEQKLYKPVIVKKVINDEHFYFVDGVFLPAVTRILQETLPTPYALKYWIGEIGNEKAEEKLKKAGDRGTLIHDACERLLKGEEISLIEEFKDKKDKKILVGFVNWCSEFQPGIISIEETVASKYGYAGTLDLFCNINNEPWIIDFKTSAGIYVSHHIQISMYRQAVLEMTGIEAKMGLLHLNPKTKKGWSLVTDIKIEGQPVTTKDITTVLEMYKVLNGGKIKEPELEENYPERIKLWEQK